MDLSLNFSPSSDSLDAFGVTGKAKTPPFIIVSLIERNRKINTVLGDCVKVGRKIRRQQNGRYWRNVINKRVLGSLLCEYRIKMSGSRKGFPEPHGRAHISGTLMIWLGINLHYCLSFSFFPCSCLHLLVYPLVLLLKFF